MATYVLLLTLTPEGRERILADPDHLRRAEAAIDVPDSELHGLYGVLGECDFVAILEAEDNESAARFSLELGARAGVHVHTLPAIPIARLEGMSRRPVSDAAGTGVGLTPPPPREESTPQGVAGAVEGRPRES
jgi:uncharacterized protein with GYD domain